MNDPIGHVPGRILVTGCTGFLAGHLIPLLKSNFVSHSVVGTSRHSPENDAFRGLNQHLVTDLSNFIQVRDLVREVQPTMVFHLASQRSRNLSLSIATNVMGTAHLLEALREEVNGFVPVVVAGSSAEIGFCEPCDLPLKESTFPRPIDVYGFTKLAQSMFVQAQWRQYSQHLVRVRIFNLLGPNLPESLLPGRCAHLLAEKIKHSCCDALMFGDLSTQRDYTDVRDVCWALVLAAQKGQSGQLYHIGSGQAKTGKSLVEGLVKRARPFMKNIEWHESPSTGTTIPIQVADSTRASLELGWKAKISLDQSLDDLWQRSLERVGVVGAREQ